MSDVSELVWVAVPGGINRRVTPAMAVLRVVIMPRLLGTSLAAEGMAHFPPPELTNGTLSVHFSSSPTASGRVVNVPPPHIRAQSGLWEAFFGPNTIITPAQGRRQRGASGVEVAKTSEEAKAVLTTFDTVARTQVTEESAAGLDPVVRRELATKWANRPPSQRMNRSGRVIENGAQNVAPTPIDFHRSIGLLREHPAVLRALGLIIDLQLPASELFADPAERFVQVQWAGAAQVPGLPRIASPWTEFGKEFLPASTTNIHAGMVTLTDENNPPVTPDDARWELVTVDVDNAASRLRAAATALVNTSPETLEESNAPGTDTGPATLPALRTAGLLLVRRGRQEDFEDRRRVSEGNMERGSFNDMVFTADDLTLGYRLDVSRSFGPWFSLHQRSASYKVNGTVPITAAPTEEGHLKALAAVDDMDGSNILRADEVVARWGGWSLAVRQPTFNTPNNRRQPSPNAQRPYDLTTDFSVLPGSLPNLRFTSTYRVRARVADLAGGGLDFNDPAADRCATQEISYRRFEPISSPAIRLPENVDPTKLGPSESVNLIVMRSDGGSVAQFQSANPGYTLNPRRILLPPRASLTLAEQHGRLDKPDGIDSATWERQTWDWASRTLASNATGDSAGLADPAAGGVCIFIRPEPGGFAATKLPRPWLETWPDLKSKQVELVERAQGTVPGSPLAWDGERLTVSLAKAEQVVLEVSSLMKDDFLDHFAIKDPLPAVSENAVMSGRHPMVTPADTVTLVHAVRRPLRDPNGTLIAQREPGQTFTVLAPNPLLLNVDPKSTGQVELTATWHDQKDDVPSDVNGARVQTVTVNRGDTQFQDTLRHEFGDTRHRMVTYTVSAVSRFRSFFNELNENPESFVARTQLAATVNVPSTAPPPTPVVLSTRPAFAWEESTTGSGTNVTVRRRRLGGGLRIELERPWFQTGDGEQLAVLVAKNVAPPESMWQFVTQVGRDPIWGTPLLNRWLTASQFRGQTGALREVFLEQAPESVVAVPYDAWFHAGRWYADVAMPDAATASYCPIVQLSVGRYQANSLAGLELSRMVKTEMVPLLPERVLTVARAGSTVTVTLEGLGPTAPQRNRVEAILEQCILPAGVSASAIDFTALDPTTGGIPAWVLVPGQIRQSDLGASAMQLEIPTGAAAVRVRVREVELVGSENGAPASQATTAGELSERVVFTDIVPFITA